MYESGLNSMSSAPTCVPAITTPPHALWNAETGARSMMPQDLDGRVSSLLIRIVSDRLSYSRTDCVHWKPETQTTTILRSRAYSELVSQHALVGCAS